MKYHQKIHNFKSLTIESDRIIYADNEGYDDFQQTDESNESYESIDEPNILQLQSKHKKSTGIENMAWYQCTQCPKIFSQKPELYRHQRIHSPIYLCEICQKQFKGEKNLHEHMQTHGVAEYLIEQ